MPNDVLRRSPRSGRAGREGRNLRGSTKPLAQHTAAQVEGQVVVGVVAQHELEVGLDTITVRGKVSLNESVCRPGKVAGLVPSEGVGRGGQSLSSSRSSAQQPRTWGPGPRRC